MIVRIHNILAQCKRHKYTTYKCSYSIKVTTTTKDDFSQCILQQQRFSKCKRLLKQHSQIIIICSLEIRENKKEGLKQTFMQYNDIIVWTRNVYGRLFLFELTTTEDEILIYYYIYYAVCAAGGCACVWSIPIILINIHYESVLSDRSKTIFTGYNVNATQLEPRRALHSLEKTKTLLSHSSSVTLEII